MCGCVHQFFGLSLVKGFEDGPFHRGRAVEVLMPMLLNGSAKTPGRTPGTAISEQASVEE